MRQILFEIPLHSLAPFLPDLPVYGWGTMLFVALVSCLWLCGRLAQRQGIERTLIYDLALWLVVGGLVGARLTFFLQYPQYFTSPWQLFAVWDGGMVSFGAFLGGTAAFLLAYDRLLRRRGVRFWQMADLLAPGLALGFCIGRFGCLLNGCCYGAVACPDCPAISFPYAAAPRLVMTQRGYQTAAGFTLDYQVDAQGRVRTITCRVAQVEPDSAADRAGLRPGDLILSVNGQEISGYRAVYAWDPRQDQPARLGLADALADHWRRGQNEVRLKVRHVHGDVQEIAFVPWTLGLHPTQLYESVSMALLLLVLLAYLPLRRAEGQVLALFALGYAAQRFLDEMLRSDTPRIFWHGTWGQIGSVLLGLCGLGLWLFARRVQRSASPLAGASSTRTTPPS